MHSNDPILVIGGTGKTGRRVAERLAARGVSVRIGSRTAQPAFDWDDPATWPAAIAGTSAAYVAFAGGLASVGLFAEVLDGRNASVTDGVQQVLDRAPRDVAETVQ